MPNKKTDFKAWTSSALSCKIIPEEPYYLYEAIDDTIEGGGDLYSCEVLENGCYLVSRPGAEPLLLTEKSREAMQKYLIEVFMDGMDPESWLGMTQSINNPHS